MGDLEKPPETDNFVHFQTKDGQRVKDKNGSSVRGRLLLAAITKPTFGQCGRGCPGLTALCHKPAGEKPESWRICSSQLLCGTPWCVDVAAQVLICQKSLRQMSDIAKQRTSAFCGVIYNRRQTSAWSNLVIPNMVIPMDTKNQILISYNKIRNCFNKRLY